MVYRINPPSNDELRRLALKRLGVTTAQNDNSDYSITGEQAKKLLEQVVISKIDVDIQNEYLQDTWTRLDTALAEARDLYDFAPVGLLSIDLQGHITKLNLTGANLLGQERSLLMGSDFAALFLPEQREGVQALLRRATDTGEDQQCEVTLHGSKVAARHMLLSLSRLPVGHGHHLVLTNISAQKRQEAALRASEACWQSALHASGDGVWDWDVQSGTVQYSDRMAQIFAAPPEFLGNTMQAWRERVHPEDWPGLLAGFQRCLSGQHKHFIHEHRGRCHDGSWKWVLCRGVVFARGSDGKVTRLMGICMDISKFKAEQARQLLAYRLQQAVFEGLPQYLAVLDAQARVLLVNGHLHAGAAQPGSAGVPYADLLGATVGGRQETRRTILAGIADVLAAKVPGFQLEYSCVQDGNLRNMVVQVLPLHEEPARALVCHQDITRLRNAAAENQRLANYDELTGALSRRHFFRVGEREFARAARYNLPLMALVIDFNDFRSINDQKGMAVGDAVLKSFVQTCREVLRDSDHIGRIGGDEFAVLLTNTLREGAAVLVQRLLNTLAAQPVVVDGQPVHCHISVGGSCLQNDDAFPDLLKRASVALRESRKASGAQVLIDSTAVRSLW